MAKRNTKSRKTGPAAGAGHLQAGPGREGMLSRLAGQWEGLHPGLADTLRRGLEQPPVAAVRLNPAKPMPGGALPWSGRPVAWHPDGLLLDERPQFTLDPCLHQGRYYVQDPSSMYIARAIEAIGTLPAGVRYLDACAAPGGKTTCAVDALPPDALITANEINPRRCQALRENVAKWGASNVEVTCLDTSRITGRYDVIAVDAPCSGEGMMRKDPEAEAQWSEALVAECAERQREILSNLWPLLEPGGALIYSTCTFNLDENDHIVEWLMNSHDALPMDLPLFDGMVGAPHGAVRFVPGLVEGEGLYMALLRKPGASSGNDAPARRTDWGGSADEAEQAQTALLRRGFRPDGPTAEVDLVTARAFLRREALRLGPEVPRGQVTLMYEEMPLGLVKNIGSRANNLYPKEWRIRHL